MPLTWERGRVARTGEPARLAFIACTRAWERGRPRPLIDPARRDAGLSLPRTFARHASDHPPRLALRIPGLFRSFELRLFGSRWKSRAEFRRGFITDSGVFECYFTGASRNSATSCDSTRIV